MNVYQHAIISTVAGLLIGFLVAPSRVIEFMLSALIFGTVVDFDHFVISRRVHGEWRFLKGVMRNPLKAIFDVQSVVKSSEEFPGEYRYLTHAVENLVVLGAGIYTGSILVYVGAFSVGLHLLSDIYADIFMW